MMLPIYQIDAFTSRLFAGNPAAVVPLEEWLEDGLLQAIAAENNLSETAFFVAEGVGFRLRWFTPAAEVDLCGHATLAAAHVLFRHLGVAGDRIRFDSRSGPLVVERLGDALVLDFPAVVPRPLAEAPEGLVDGLGLAPVAVLEAPDLIAVYAHQDQIVGLDPDFAALKRMPTRGVLATAPGEDCDFVSRCFFPRLAVDEDPVTGSAHCWLAPYWAGRLGRSRLQARQLSQRGGEIQIELIGDRVRLIGQAVDYLKGEILLPQR